MTTIPKSSALNQVDENFLLNHRNLSAQERVVRFYRLGWKISGNFDNFTPSGAKFKGIG